MQEIHGTDLFQEEDKVKEIRIQDIYWLADLALHGDVDRRQNSQPFLSQSSGDACFA